MKRLILSVLLVGTTWAAVADHIKGETVTETFTHAKDMNAPRKFLPAMFEICKSLGLSKEKCVEYDGININGGTQTDQNLWYSGSYGSTEPVTDAQCHKAIPIYHYVTWEGNVGTTYVCLAQPEDDTITAANLAAIKRFAEHSNSIGKKTLDDHEIAMQVKRIAEWLADPKH